MVDASLFKTCGELQQEVDETLRRLLDPLPKPLTVDAVEAALEGRVKWWGYRPTFHDPMDEDGVDSTQYDDVIIHAQGLSGFYSLVGYRCILSDAVGTPGHPARRDPGERALTTAWARQQGYEVSRGSFFGAADNRADRWYVDAIAGELRDRRGPGQRTRRAALAALAMGMLSRGGRGAVRVRGLTAARRGPGERGRQ